MFPWGGCRGDMNGVSVSQRSRRQPADLESQALTIVGRIARRLDPFAENDAHLGIDVLSPPLARPMPVRGAANCARFLRL